MGIIKKIQTARVNRKTYKIGLLQHRAYKILKAHTAQGLLKYNISTIEWAFLGLLYDSQDNLKSKQLADSLGVEAPFVTTLYTHLNELGFVEFKKSPTDSRIKIIILTSQGRHIVPVIEGELRIHMKSLVSEVSLSDILSYISVLEEIIDSSNKLTNKIHTYE